jgi:hypothetical protein
MQIIKDPSSYLISHENQANCILITAEKANERRAYNIREEPRLQGSRGKARQGKARQGKAGNGLYPSLEANRFRTPRLLLFADRKG